MDTERTTIHFEGALEILVADGDDVTLGQPVLTDDDGPLLEALLPYPAWARILEAGVFGLGTMDASGPGPEVLEVGKDVRIRICPSDEIEEKFTLVELAQALSAADPFVCQSDAWLLLEASQEVQLPDGVEGSASVGFQTSWSEVEDSSALATSVFQWLEDTDLAPEVLKDDLARVELEVEDIDWTLLVRVDAETSIVGFYSVFPERVPEAARHDVALFLISQNYELPVGSFEMDPEDGEIRFRTTWIQAGDEAPSADMLFDTLSPHLAIVAAHLEATESLIATVLEDAAG
jgi:hypothetical protein